MWRHDRVTTQKTTYILYKFDISNVEYDEKKEEEEELVDSKLTGTLDQGFLQKILSVRKHKAKHN